MWYTCILVYACKKRGRQEQKEQTLLCLWVQCMSYLWNHLIYTELSQVLQRIMGPLDGLMDNVHECSGWSLAPLCPVLYQPLVSMDHLSHVCGYSSCPANRNVFAPSPRKAHMPVQMLLLLQGAAPHWVDPSTVWQLGDQDLESEIWI